MVTIYRIKCLFTIIVILIVFPSCTEMKNRISPQTSTQTSVQTQVQTENQVRQHLRSGEYQKAIDFYKTKYEKHPEDRLLVKGYVNILEEIKTMADGALDRENLVPAGKAYNVLLKNYPDLKIFADTLSFDRAQLNSKLTSCKTSLSRKGFQAYREGNISEAISLWQDNLVIDPDNTDIRKALNTAKMQQKNLQLTK